MAFHTIIEPFRIHSVEPLRMTTETQRRTAIRAAGYNVFNLHATDVLIDFRDTTDPEEEIAERSGIDEPIFEMVTVCQARRGVGDGDSDQAEGQFLALNQKKHLNLYSTSIINALRSVVKYYPSQDLSGNPVKIHYPYAVLVHHYDELSVFRDACAAKSPA